MKKRKAFLIVGHRHWGKSVTLSALANGKRSMILDGKTLSVRRMSNDDIDKDDPEKFWRFVRDLSDLYAVFAFCPKFDGDAQFVRHKLDAPTILKKLNENYQLFFWVIKHSQNPKRKRPREIDEATLERLRDYGTLEIFDRLNATPKELAEALEAFLKKSLP